MVPMHNFNKHSVQVKNIDILIVKITLQMMLLHSNQSTLYTIDNEGYNFITSSSALVLDPT